MNEQRGAAARIGIVLLNVVAAGLGLLRLGDWKIALVFFGISCLNLLFFRLAPVVPFALLILVAAIALSNVIAAFVASWRGSRTRRQDLPIYSRWYGIVAAALLASVTGLFLGDHDSWRYRSFYMPSESMAPTLPKNDRVIAYMGSAGKLRRGDLVLVLAPRGDIYLKRVAALPGDQFSMRKGVVILNGVATQQRDVGSDRTQGSFRVERAKKLLEQFPGEPAAHEIYDLGASPGDDVEEIIVPDGSVFLLGDHRDRSSDSRFPLEMDGLGGPVPLANIVGRPLYQSWGSSRPLGTKLFN